MTERNETDSHESNESKLKGLLPCQVSMEKIYGVDSSVKGKLFVQKQKQCSASGADDILLWWIRRVIL